MSTALVPLHRGAPRTATPSVQPSPPTLLCNLCHKPLATTCFLCACDCIYCEDCTYSHFEKHSDCPTCGRTLSENDFTELVVAEASSSTSDISKTSLQALFSRHSKSNSKSKALPFSDLCYSLVRQIDVVKQSTKFLLKQLLMDSSTQSRRSVGMARNVESLKNEITNLKQLHSAQRLQLEQVNADLQNRLQAREASNAELHKKIKEQERMLDQFRQLHNGMAVSSDNNERQRPLNSHHIPDSSSGRESSRNTLGKRTHGGQEPPMKGFMLQKEAAAQQQALNARRQPNLMGPRMNSSSMAMRGNSGGNMPSQHFNRPFSTGSNGSLPNTPRIRELSSSAGYNFTGTSTQGYHHLNKRRRGETSGSSGGTSSNYVMSPNTAFALNQGPHGATGNQRWMQQNGNSSRMSGGHLRR